MITPPKHFERIDSSERHLQASRDKFKKVFEPNSFVSELISYSNRIMTYDLAGEIRTSSTNDDIYDVAYFVDSQHIYLTYDLPRISHQIAHMLELNNPRRWVMDDWGFKTFDLGDLKISNAYFMRAVVREIKVRAIERHIQDCPVLINNKAWVKEIQERLPFVKFKFYTEFLLWHDYLTQQTFNQWNKDRIRKEWKIRIDYIHQWMDQQTHCYI